MSITVLIADDQALLRTGFQRILETEPDIEVVGAVRDGVMAIDQVRALRPDVVLMDIRMPKMDGLEATRRIAGESRVLILTTFDLDEYVYEALRAGASGFVLKDAPVEELLHAVRVVARGDALLSPSVTRRLIDEFARRPQANVSSTSLDPLSPREVEVLRLVARGLSNTEIAVVMFLGEATVKTHVTHILQKLGLRDRTQAVITAYESGLVQPGTSPRVD